jgi:hypothetical protein
MEKRKLHHLLVRLRPVSYWYFVVMLVVSGGLALYALRQNNLTALRLRDNVLEVDKNNGDVESALRELREYTYSHMNARLATDTGIYPPIQLKYRYDRLVAAEKERANASNANLYSQAQTTCEAQFPSGLSGSNRLPCIRQYIDSHGTAEVKEQPIPDALYKFDFVSPLWSPDIAGWMLVTCALSLILLVTRVASQIWLKNRLSH